MLLVHCPVCGAEGDETDFHYGGEAHLRRPASHDPAHVSDAEQRDYLFMRHNPKGLHFERWRCDRGCGKWFHAVRDTMTMEFKTTYGITELPPANGWKRQPANGRSSSRTSSRKAPARRNRRHDRQALPPARARTPHRSDEESELHFRRRKHVGLCRRHPRLRRPRPWPAPLR